MAYAKQTWVDGADGATPITAARLGYIEDGVEAAHEAAEAAATAEHSHAYAATVHTHLSADVTDATNLATVSTIVKRSNTGTANFTNVRVSSTPTDADHVARKDYVDGAVATKADTVHTHTASQVTDLTETVQDTVGAMVEAGTGIAVTYNDTTGILSIDATGSGITSVGYADLPAGTTLTVLKSGGVWPARPTARADLIVAWKGADPSPSIVSSGTGGMLDNVDYRLVTP